MNTATLSLEKGNKVDLTKTNPGLKLAHIGLGWDINAGSGAAFDLDAFALMLNASEKLPGMDHVVYFRNLKKDGVEHTGDNLTGAGDGDDETIKIFLDQIPATIESVLICVNIFDANSRRQNFGQVKNAFIRIYNPDGNVELMKYDLNEDYSAFNAMVMGKLYRHSGEWKFQAVGEGKNGDINAVAAGYVS